MVPLPCATYTVVAGLDRAYDAVVTKEALTACKTYEAVVAVPNKLPVNEPDALKAKEAVATDIELVWDVNTYGCSIDAVALVSTYGCNIELV